MKMSNEYYLLTLFNSTRLNVVKKTFIRMKEQKSACFGKHFLLLPSILRGAVCLKHISGRCPIPHKRNFFEKKFLLTLQKT